jgi:hypothetical protein
MGGAATGTAGAAGETSLGPAPDDTVLTALVDFPETDVGDIPYYQDTSARMALAIDAGIYRDSEVFAAARTTFPGESYVYDVILTTLGEEDGESSYKLFVGNAFVEPTYQNVPVDAANDNTPQTHTWTNVSVELGDTIDIPANPQSNGMLFDDPPQNTLSAYARGRWQQVVFTPAAQ